ncbi:MAG: hypothetical protein V1909_00020 [Candidatus Micrarchaeota archaeon]
MLKDKGEIAFYAISGIALSLVFWSFGFFKLRGFPLGAPLMLSFFTANLLLAYIGQKMLGEEQEESVVKAVFICAVASFFLAWAANLEQDVLGSVALPATIMFLSPSILYYVRRAVTRSESDVQTG